MDRKYLEEHLSAYLDNELEPKKLREFEEALKAYPDLQQQVARLQRLNKFARDTEVPMPAEGYFDNLAERIESRIEREYPKERGKIVEFLLARRKTVAIISSVAAVLLITVISVEFYGPEREMYPSKFQKTIEIKSDTARQPVPAAMPKAEEKEDASRVKVKPPTVYGDTARGEARAKAVPEADVAAKDAVVTEEPMLKSSEQRVIHGAPSSLGAVETANLTTAKPAVEAQAETAPASDTSHAVSTQKIVIDSSGGAAEPVTVQRDLLTPLEIVERSLKPKEQPKKLEKSAVSKQSQAVSGESAADQSSSSEYHFNYDGSLEPPEIIPDSLLEKYGNERVLDITRQVSAEEVYRQLKAELAKGVYRKFSFLSRPGSEDSVRAWVDSFAVLGPAHWWAEEWYRRELADKHLTEVDIAFCRAYIEHYLQMPEAVDAALWRARLDAIEEIYEQKLRERER